MTDKFILINAKYLKKNPCTKKCKNYKDDLDFCAWKRDCHILKQYEAQQEVLKLGREINIDEMITELNKILRRNIAKAESVLKKQRR